MGVRIQAVSTDCQFVFEVGYFGRRTRYHPVGWLFLGMVACEVSTMRTLGAMMEVCIGVEIIEYMFKGLKL
jgi:hypothetical protein